MGVPRVATPLLLAACIPALVGCYERGGNDKAKPTSKPADLTTPRKPVPAAIDAGTVVAADPNATLRIRLATEPVHLNPLLAGEATVNRVALGDIYEGLLCERVLGSQPIPCLASSYTVSGDGKQWTFRLRDGVSWHDGKPFSVADAVFTFRLLMDKKLVTWLRGDFGDLSQVRSDKPGELTLLFSSFRPDRLSAFTAVPILPKHVFTQDPAAMRTAAANRAPVGTGPLRLRSWKSGESISLERFSRYWGVKPKLGRVVYRIMPNRQRALAALAAGTLDLVTELPVDQALAQKKRTPSLELFSYPRHAYLAAVHNVRRPMLANVDIRRALTHSLDRKGIVRSLFHGFASVVSGPFPANSRSHDPRAVPLVFGSKATALAVKRSKLAKRAVIELLVPTESRTMRRIADIWVQDAKPHLKLKVVLAPYTKVLSRARSGKFDVALLAFTTTPEIDLYTRLHSSQAGRENYGAFKDGQLDALITKARTTADATARSNHLRAIHRRIHDLQPYTFIASDHRLGLARPGVSGIRTGSYGPQSRALWRSK